MRVILAGGGTGGHLYPAIAMAREILKRNREAAVLFVGTSEGIESRILPKEGLALRTIRIRGLKRKKPAEQLVAVLGFPIALVQSVIILRGFRPDAVIGVGGYASGPLVLAAWLLRLKTMLQEQNSVPGMTNRVLARFADRIYTAYEEAGSNFTKEKVVCSGNPLREEILQGKREEAMESFGMSPERMTLVILGGSRGAHAINQLVSAMIRDKGWSALPVQFLHQTGEADYEAVCEAYHDAGIKAEVRPYFDDMGLLYRAADLAISRAGAVALSELMAVGVPAILIPFPFAADDHQMRNAKICASSGAATVFAEQGLTPKKLGGYVQSLLENREQLSSMKEAAKRQGRSDAARRVIDDIEQVVGRGT